MSLTRIVSLTLAALAALGLAAAHPAAAATTIYNFEIRGDSAKGSNTLFSGTGALGGGNYWNLANSPVTNAVDSNNGASGVGFSAGSNGFYTGPNDATAANPDQLLANFAYTGGTGNVKNLHFTGLASNTVFTLDLYGINGGFNNNNTIFNLTGSDYTTIKSTATTTNVQDTTFVQGDNYVQFTGTTDATGNVYATYQGTLRSPGEGDFNGAQISLTPSSAPEPAQTAVLGFFGLGLGALILKARNRSAAQITA